MGSAYDDHGIEVLRKSGELVTPPDKSDTYLKVGPTPGHPLEVIFANPDTPTIYNVASTGADVEFTQSLAGTVQRITIQARGNSRIKFSYSTQGDYITIPPGASYSEDNVKLVGQTLYLKTSLGTDVVEVLTWA